MTTTVWPKTIAPLTEEQRRISDDFMKYWHEELPRKYGLVDRFNHLYPVKNAEAGFRRTLEIGAGLGEHLEYETLTEGQEREYYALELRDNMAEEIRRRFPKVQTIVGDCQKRLDFDDGYFDRILAIHVLEHLPNLPAAVRELHRLCEPETGRLSVVIPCEGSPAYSLARRVSAQRIFEKRYNQPYEWFISREHINVPREILGVLSESFEVVSRRHFPVPVPFEFCNLVIGLTLKPRSNP